MPRLAVSLDESQYDWIESQAESRDVSRAEIVRQLVERGRENDSLLNHGEPVSESDRESLKDRIDRLEAEVERITSDSPVNQGDSRPNHNQTVSDSSGRRESESSPETVERPARGGGRDETATLEAGSGPGGSGGLDDAIQAVGGIEWGDETRGDPEDYREALRAVLRELDTAGDGLSKSEIQERVFPEHSVGFGKDRWWKNLVWKCLKELRDDAEVVHTQGGGKYTTWHLGPEEIDVYDPAEEF